MRLLSVSDNDLRLLNALKPFLSIRGQEIVELFSTVVDVFRPQDPEQKINIEALSTLLSIVAEPQETEKNESESEKDNTEEDKTEQENSSTMPDKSQELENLLNILADKEKDA
ncbi:hypothetical protein [Thermosediminibacter oceani]|uniref:Uncharacterized protein n=1 Tax=Thermosediminibacter oceani (strain ATCC BAA-1034 / DSM 16646 / JW/IW-1228P) TaxID=555079 RepID=D9S294_THEOJ|nr:hypothetical protein [Thermosediminibacter oceani]ADL07521.1 hypothetical protein Toce_0755 [Thermosediminibacter oceani DSM 16646]